MSSCWLLTGFKESISAPGDGVPRLGVPYRGEADCWSDGCVCWPTVDMKFSVRDLEAWMFFVRSSRTSLKLSETLLSLPCSRYTTFLLCSPSWSAFGCCCLTRPCSEDICWFSDDRSCLMMNVSSLISTGLSSNSVLRRATVVSGQSRSLRIAGAPVACVAEGIVTKSARAR